MIVNFRHKGLEQLWTKGKSMLLPADQIRKISLILQTLDGIVDFPDDLLQFPNWKLHSLRGDRDGQWSVTVKTNWRIVFRYDGQNALDIDYVDYH